MSRKRVAISVRTPRRRRQQQKRRRHNDDIHDEDVENQQPSPHPMPTIILPQALNFLHAPNTFKPVSYIGDMNNTSSTVLNLKKKRGLQHAFMSQNPSFISKSFFYHYISVHCPKTQALYLLGFFPYISVHCPKTQALSLYIVSKPKLYLFKFLPLYFRTLSQKSKARRPSMYYIKLVHFINDAFFQRGPLSDVKYN